MKRKSAPGWRSSSDVASDSVRRAEPDQSIITAKVRFDKAEVELRKSNAKSGLETIIAYGDDPKVHEIRVGDLLLSTYEKLGMISGDQSAPVFPSLCGMDHAPYETSQDMEEDLVFAGASVDAHSPSKDVDRLLAVKCAGISTGFNIGIQRIVHGDRIKFIVPYFDKAMGRAPDAAWASANALNLYQGHRRITPHVAKFDPLETELLMRRIYYRLAVNHTAYAPLNQFLDPVMANNAKPSRIDMTAICTLQNILASAMAVNKVLQKRGWIKILTPETYELDREIKKMTDKLIAMDPEDNDAEALRLAYHRRIRSLNEERKRMDCERNSNTDFVKNLFLDNGLKFNPETSELYVFESVLTREEKLKNENEFNWLCMKLGLAENSNQYGALKRGAASPNVMKDIVHQYFCKYAQSLPNDDTGLKYVYNNDPINVDLLSETRDHSHTVAFQVDRSLSDTPDIVSGNTMLMYDSMLRTVIGTAVRGSMPGEEQTYILSTMTK
jgi:hypothetical protein